MGVETEVIQVQTPEGPVTCVYATRHANDGGISCDWVGLHQTATP